MGFWNLNKKDTFFPIWQYFFICGYKLKNGTSNSINQYLLIHPVLFILPDVTKKNTILYLNTYILPSLNEGADVQSKLALLGKSASRHIDSIKVTLFEFYEEKIILNTSYTVHTLYNKKRSKYFIYFLIISDIFFYWKKFLFSYS